MKENEILSEIHRECAEIARECGYGLSKLFERMRERTEKLKAEGWQVVSPAPREAESTCALREEPPQKPGQPCNIHLPVDSQHK